MGAQRLEAARRLLDQRADFGIGFDVAEIEAEADPPAAHTLVEADRVVARLGRQRAPVARIGAGHGVQRQRRVEHAARQHALADHVGERRVGGILRDAPVGRLQPDQAGMGGGNADRAAAVIAVVERSDAGRGHRRGAARRAAGRVAEVPRAARGALQRRIGQRLPAELRGRALADDRHAGGAQAGRHGASSARGVSSVACEPIRVGQPFTVVVSLIEVGTPSSGDNGSPCASAPRTARAAARAPSGSISTRKLRCGCRRSARASTCSITSTGERVAAAEGRPSRRRRSRNIIGHAVYLGRGSTPPSISAWRSGPACSEAKPAPKLGRSRGNAWSR